LELKHLHTFRQQLAYIENYKLAHEHKHIYPGADLKVLNNSVDEGGKEGKL
jgi:hypothetical protein